MAVLSTFVIVSPAPRPAAAAGPPCSTPSITAPDEVGSTETPRKPGYPMWIELVSMPFSICATIESASLTGIAKPVRCPLVLAAVSMPTTRPATL